MTNEEQRRVEALFIECNLSGDPHVELSPSGHPIPHSISGIEAAIEMIAGEFAAPVAE